MFDSIYYPFLSLSFSLALYIYIHPFSSVSHRIASQIVARDFSPDAISFLLARLRHIIRFQNAFQLDRKCRTLMYYVMDMVFLVVVVVCFCFIWSAVRSLLLSHDAQTYKSIQNGNSTDFYLGTFTKIVMSFLMYPIHGRHSFIYLYKFILFLFFLIFFRAVYMHL